MQKNKNNERLIFIIAITAFLIGVVLFVTKNLKKNIEFYYDISEINASTTEKIRIGGLVLEGSISYSDNKKEVIFILTDYKAEITVRYKGVPPDLFREGQGIIATGYLENNTFIATMLFAKHDENYKPKELYSINSNK